MSKEETKQHFAEICECIWNKIESEEKLDAEDTECMRVIVTRFAVIAWNMSLVHKSLPELKKAVRKFANDNYDGSPNALILLMDAAELKWQDYRNDKDVIAGAEVKTVKGKPQVIVYLKGDSPELNSPAKAFHDFMNSPEIQERLKHIPPEKLEEEIGKIVAEYNASLPKPPVMHDNDEKNAESFERDFPITREELEFAYQYTLTEVKQEDKKEILAELLKFQPFLAPLCKNAYQFPFSPKETDIGGKTAFTTNTIPDMILTLASVYMQDTNLMELDKQTQRDLKNIARDLVFDFIKNREDFEDTLETFPEPNLYAFLAETLDKFNLSSKDFKQKLADLMMWGFMIEEARRVQHPGKYPDFENDDEPQEEHYDFDEKNLRVLLLHVKLRGFRCSADVLVREDSTFEDLHDFLNPLFNREDDHLYRFECDDGCTTVCNEEEIEEDEVLSCDSYVGHHLTKESGAYYLFDYGDEWEHDISVKKILPVNPQEQYPKVLKITGKIPEQYPDYEDEE